MIALLSVLQQTPEYGAIALLLLGGLIYCAVKNLKVIAGTLAVLLIGMTLFLQNTEPAIAAKARARQKRMNQKLEERLQEKAASEGAKSGKKVRKSVGTQILPRASRLRGYTPEEIRAAKDAAEAQGLTAQDAIRALEEEQRLEDEEDEEEGFSAPGMLSPEEKAKRIENAKEEIDQKMKEHVDQIKGAADKTRNLLQELKGR